VISRKLRFRQTSNAFLLRFVVFDNFDKIYGFVFSDPGMPSRFPVAHEIFGGHNFCNVSFFLMIWKNMKSAWRIISVETESLNLLQFSTLSKYMKIYGAHATIIYWSLLFDLVWKKQFVIYLLLYYINGRTRKKTSDDKYLQKMIFENQKSTFTHRIDRNIKL
jgi:hypothetical protein